MGNYLCLRYRAISARMACMTDTSTETTKKRSRKRSAPAVATNGRAPMSDEHKAALAEGREQGRVVRRYLEALAAHQPKRGRKRDLGAAQVRVEAVEAEIETADPLTRLHLTQELMDLRAALSAGEEDDGSALAEAEEAFLYAAAAYGARKGISYAAWREAGVSADVLRRSGIPRST